MVMSSPAVYDTDDRFVLDVMTAILCVEFREIYKPSVWILFRESYCVLLFLSECEESIESLFICFVDFCFWHI